ncbi:MAG: LPS export ABC transporter periplasmic protein LptC [Alphaproteobacteria bacterium]|nr:LPS export ABC transporter periplasmic protein LptC [Alphaproteobacteria bacterium]
MAITMAMNSMQDPPFDAQLQARFRRAERHSRQVRFLRVAVPAAVALSMALIVARATILNPFYHAAGNLPAITDVGIEGSKVSGKMHLKGTSPDKRPYEVWADRAIEDILDPNHIELQGLLGKMLMADDSTLVLNARSGFFDNKSQVLDLRKDIVLHTSAGQEARLSRAVVDMTKGTITSDEPVVVKLGTANVSSNRLTVSEGGAVVHFEGNVVMNIEKFGN